MWLFINQDDSQGVIYDLSIDPLELRNHVLSDMKIDVDIKQREVLDRVSYCCWFSFNYRHERVVEQSEIMKLLPNIEP
jgi:hypothetical protein